MKFIMIKEHIVNVSKLLCCRFGKQDTRYCIYFVFDIVSGGNHTPHLEYVFYEHEQEAKQDFQKVIGFMKSLLVTDFQY